MSLVGLIFFPVGSCLVFMAESGVWGDMPQAGVYVDKLAPILNVAHRDFLQFKKVHKLDCSQPRFTPARLQRKLQNRILVTTMDYV